MSVANFHGEVAFASTISDALHMPFPDADIIHVLVEERIFENRNKNETLSIAHAHDRENRIQRIRLVLVSFQTRHGTQPMEYHFRADFHADDSNVSDDEDANDDEPSARDSAHLFYMA